MIWWTKLYQYNTLGMSTIYIPIHLSSLLEHFPSFMTHLKRGLTTSLARTT